MKSRTVRIAAALAPAAGYAANPFITGGSYASPLCGGDEFRCWFGDRKIPIKNITCGPPSAGNDGQRQGQQRYTVCSPKRIVWKIDDHTYNFTPTGIELKTPNPDFDPADADHTDWKFTWSNKHNNLGRSLMDAVTVQNNGNDCVHQDPRIYNE